MELYGFTNYYSYSLSRRKTSNFLDPHPFSMSILSMCHRIRLIVAMRHQLPSQKKRKKKEGNEATSANSLLFSVTCLAANIFSGAFSPCAKLRRRTSFRKLSNNLLAPPKLFTSRGATFRFSVKLVLAIIHNLYSGISRAHDIRAHASFLLVPHAGLSPASARE